MTGMVRAPVVQATGEAEAGELPEPRRQRLQWAKIAPLHSSLSNKGETPSQKKKTQANKNLYYIDKEISLWEEKQMNLSYHQQIILAVDLIFWVAWHY